MARYFFTVNNISGVRVAIHPLLKKIEKALPRTNKRGQHEYSIVVVSPAKMRSLNRKYHQQNRVTDVLTFATEADSSEIVVCPEFIAQQARVAGEPAWVFLAHALVHGVVHALGHHHELGGRAERAAVKLEEKILAEIGIKHE